MSDRDTRQAAKDELPVADGGPELRRRLSSFAGIPGTAAARTPDPLPDMSTALDRLHVARRAAGIPDLDEDEGLAPAFDWLAKRASRSRRRSTDDKFRSFARP